MDWSLPQTLNDIKQVSYLSIFLRSFLFSCGHVVNLNGWQTISSLLHHLQAGVLGKKTEISTQCPCYLANSDARLHHSQFTLPLLHTQAIIIIPCYYLCKMNFRDNCPEEFSHNGNVFQFRYYDFTKTGVLIQWLVKRVQISRKWIHEVTETGLEPRTTSFLNEHSTIWPNWPNDGAVFWVLICTMHLTVCSCHVTYAFQSESVQISTQNTTAPYR